MGRIAIEKRVSSFKTTMGHHNSPHLFLRNRFNGYWLITRCVALIVAGHWVTPNLHSDSSAFAVLSTPLHTLSTVPFAQGLYVVVR